MGNESSYLLRKKRDLGKVFWKQYESYKSKISQFHDKVMKDLQSSDDFIIFVHTPTLKLFQLLAKNVQAVKLLVTPNEEYAEAYLDNYPPPSYNVEEQQDGAKFAEDMSWRSQVDKKSIDYRLSDFDLKPRELYLETNHNKIFVYLDLKSANFNSLRLLNPNLVLNCGSWEELCEK